MAACGAEIKVAVGSCRSPPICFDVVARVRGRA